MYKYSGNQEQNKYMKKEIYIQEGEETQVKDTNFSFFLSHILHHDHRFPSLFFSQSLPTSPFL